MIVKNFVAWLSLHVQILKIKKTFTAPYYERGSTASRLQSHYKEAVYFFTISSQKFLLLILSTSEGWKVTSILEPHGGFEHGTYRLEPP